MTGKVFLSGWQHGMSNLYLTASYHTNLIQYMGVSFLHLSRYLFVLSTTFKNWNAGVIYSLTEPLILRHIHFSCSHSKKKVPLQSLIHDSKAKPSPSPQKHKTQNSLKPVNCFNECE